MINASQNEPYVPRVDRITAEMEVNWRKYDFRDRQEMVDWYFGFTRKFLNVILGNQDDKLGVMNVRTPEDMLRLYQLEEFRKDPTTQFS